MLLFEKKTVETAEEYFEAVKAGYQPALLSWKNTDRSDELLGYVTAKRFENDDAACLYFAEKVSDWDNEDMLIAEEDEKTLQDLNRLRELAESGKALACTVYGSYLVGMGFNEERTRKGIVYLEKAVLQGDVNAADRLGRLFCMESSYQDVKKAEYYCLFACERGYFASLDWLIGIWLDEDRGEEAVRLLEKAHGEGVGFAAERLGDLYSNANNIPVKSETALRTRGKYISLDWKKAWEWYSLASRDLSLNESQRAYAIFRMAYALEHGYGVARDEAKAFALYKNTVKDCSASAARLGRAYEEGWFVEKDLKKAVYWYQRGDDSPYAMYRLGYFYYNGIHVKQNEKKAREYLNYATLDAYRWEDGYEQARAFLAEINGEAYVPAEPTYQPAPQSVSQPAPQTAERKEKTPFEQLCESAESGDVAAQLDLGLSYWEGVNGVKDPVKAAYWWTKASEGDSAEARAFLAACYMEGKGVKRDPSIGIRLMEKSASQGCGAACSMLAIAYEKGDCVEVDYDRAYAWYKKALELGLPEKRRQKTEERLAEYEKNRCPSCDSFYCKAEKRSIFGVEYYCKKCGYKY